MAVLVANKNYSVLMIIESPEMARSPHITNDMMITIINNN